MSVEKIVGIPDTPDEILQTRHGIYERDCSYFRFSGEGV